MPYEPTPLEVRAADRQAEAMQAIARAAGLFGEAEQALLDEERRHLAPSPSNNAKLCRYAEAVSGLYAIRETMAP